MYAHLRRGGDNPKLRRHPLASSLRTLDARSYTEITTLDVRGQVMGLALEPSDTYVAVVTWDGGGWVCGGVQAGPQHPAAAACTCTGAHAIVMRMLCANGLGARWVSCVCSCTAGGSGDVAITWCIILP